MNRSEILKWKSKYFSRLNSESQKRCDKEKVLVNLEKVIMVVKYVVPLCHDKVTTYGTILYTRPDMIGVLTRRTNTKVNWCSPLV